jgi:hypothetical protein
LTPFLRGLSNLAKFGARCDLRSSVIGGERRGFSFIPKRWRRRMQHLGSEVRERILDYKGMEGSTRGQSRSWLFAQAIAMVSFVVGFITVHIPRQTPARLVEKAGDILGGVDHLKFAHVEGVDLRQISATAFFPAQQHRLEFVVVYAIAGQQPAQHPVRGTAIHLRQHVHEEFRLRAIVRGITVDLEESGQAPD